VVSHLRYLDQCKIWSLERPTVFRAPQNYMPHHRILQCCTESTSYRRISLLCRQKWVKLRLWLAKQLRWDHISHQLLQLLAGQWFSGHLYSECHTPMAHHSSTHWPAVNPSPCAVVLSGVSSPACLARLRIWKEYLRYGKRQEENRKEVEEHWHRQIRKIWQHKPTSQP